MFLQLSRDFVFLFIYIAAMLFAIYEKILQWLYLLAIYT